MKTKQKIDKSEPYFVHMAIRSHVSLRKQSCVGKVVI